MRAKVDINKYFIESNQIRSTKDDILIEYNNESYFISQDMMERIMRKKKNIRLRDLGISYAEHFDEEILNKNLPEYKKKRDLMGKSLEELKDDGFRVG
jgi:anaerobic ribonucleoside-triphosphate reductase